MKHGRLPWLAPAELDDAQRRLYDTITATRGGSARRTPLVGPEGRLHGPFNAMLLRSDLGIVVQELGARIRHSGVLSGRERELAILEVARLRRSRYEWLGHEHAGRNAGLTDAELAALRTGDAAGSLSARETLVRDLVRSLIHDRDITDSRFTEFEAGLGLDALLEVITLVGYYDLLALLLRVLRVPLPAGHEDQAPWPGDH